MRHLRQNAEHPTLSALRAGRVTPSMIEGRLRSLRDELSDAEVFKYPEQQLKMIRDAIAALEISLVEGREAFDAGVRSRASEYAVASVVADVPAKERKAAHLAKLRSTLSTLQGDLNDAIRYRDAQSQIDRINVRIQAVRREILEFEQDLAPSKAQNPRRRHTHQYALGARRDLESGRLSMGDIARRLDRYRRLLAETRSGDPEARDRILSLSEHIQDLERVLRGKKAV